MDASSIIAVVKKQPVGIVCGLVSLACVGLLYLRSDLIEEHQAEYESKSAERDRILANVRNATNLPEQVVEIQALSKELDSRMVRSGQLAVNLQYFYKLEAENEVKLVDVHQNNGSPGKNPYFGIPYGLTVTGGYKQIMAFLQKLEAGRHFCQFKSATFSKSGGGDGMTMTLNIELLGTP